MRDRERGIGNLPFIAVLVLFVVAIALFFMKQDEADQFKSKWSDADEKANAAIIRFAKLDALYKAVNDVVGINDAGLGIPTDPKAAMPTTDAVKGILRDYLNKVAGAVTRASKTKLVNRIYKTDGPTKSTPGDPKVLELYSMSMGKENVTFRGVFDGLEKAMKSAAKIAMDNNKLFEGEKSKYDAAVKTAEATNKDAATKYLAESKAQKTAAESAAQDAKKARDNNVGLSTKIDRLETENSTNKDKWAGEKRKLQRQLSAAENRYINEKDKKIVAMKEDPRDGGVLRVSNTLGTVWINLGTKHKLSRGTMFKVWRSSKGNIRQNIATIKVINVHKTSAECRIVKQIHRRVGPTKGMNISNPFYDPTGKLRVYIYGDLKNYPTDIAARRLAANGAVVSRSLDDTVNVIVLGSPPRSGDEEMPDDETEAAAAEKKASMDRARRLDVVMRKAITIGAIVVTEDVLATFIDY